MRRLAPDYRTIAAFRHDNPEAIVSASAAFVQFCRRQGLIGGRMVALDGTKMLAVASPKNIAGTERLARDLAHTEREIAYYLDRLDVIDDQVSQGFDDQPAHREAFAGAILPLSRRRDRLARRHEELAKREEKVLVFGEPEAKPMGYAHAPKLPSYNVQSVVDVESGLIVHHDVYNDANDSHLLHPMSTAAKEMLEVEELHVLTDGGYSNAEEIARCEREAITVSAPIKRGAMNSEHFRPTQFKDCRLKSRCTPGAQRTIHRLWDQAALDRMEARIYADPSLMKTRRCTVEHPFGTMKRMSGGGRFLTRGLRRVKAEAALSVLAFNIIHAMNAFGAASSRRQAEPTGACASALDGNCGDANAASFCTAWGQTVQKLCRRFR